MPPANISIKDFTGGWNPSFDALNAPANVLLRADNLVWDEQGVVKLRAGSVKVNASPFSGTVNRMFTTVLNGSRVRMTGSGNSVYENGTLISALGSGAGDFSFGSHMGQILITKGTLKLKWDGAIARTWGIPDPATAPTVVQDTGNSTTIAVGNEAGWAADTSEGTIASVANHAGVAARAQEITPNATSFRGVASLAFAAVDLNDYSGEAGSDTDLVELYVRLERSELLTSLSIQLDANAASSSPFQDDYYQAILDLTTGIQVKLSADQAVANATVEGRDRDRVRQNIRSEADPTAGRAEEGFATTRVGRAKAWTKLTISRGAFERVGATAGKNWSTICGVRIVAQFSATGAKVAFDTITISGGEDHALTGAYKFRYIHVYNSGEYQGKSQLSPVSESIDLHASAATVTIPASTNTTVNECWVYMLGGGLNRFYRVGKLVANGGSISVGMSEVNAAILNLTTENNSEPPDDIIGIVGPHAARTWVLTATGLYPSRRNNPESFDLTQMIEVGDETETAYWVVLTTEGSLFVGTSKSIYSISGYGLEYPDGTTDFVKRTVQVEPPTDSGVTTDGYTIFYMASDGWRAFAGGVSKRIVGVLDLLYRQVNRYGVTGVNLGSSHARFRCAFLNGQLFCLSGEGDVGNDEYSYALHVFDMGNGKPERRLYTFQIASLYREPDGKILAGCTDGYVRELEVGDNDDGAIIGFEFYTPLYDGETPLNFKDPFGMEMHADTGNTSVDVELLVDAQTAALFSTTFVSPSQQPIIRRIDTLTPFRAVQARVSGTSNTFTLRGLHFNYRLRPQRRLYVDTGYIDTGSNLNTWIRRLRLKARIQSAVTFVCYFDDTAFTLYTSPAATPLNKVTHIQIPVPKNYKGRQPRIVMYATDNTPLPPGGTDGMRIDEFSEFPSGVDFSAAERMRFATVGFGINTGDDAEDDHSFEAYGLEITYFPTGAQTEARKQWVSIG